MHVRGQPLVAIEKLDQQRKVIAVAGEDFLADQLRAELLHQLAQRFAGQRPVDDDRLLFAVIGNFPGLGDIAVAGTSSFSQNFDETPPAVRIELEIRLELEVDKAWVSFGEDLNRSNW